MPVTAIPARLSVSDPDYDYRVGSELEIRLNGVLQDQVISYDIEAGTIERIERDADGKPVVHYTREKLSVEIVQGEVTVRLRPSIAPLKRLLTVTNLMTLACNRPKLPR